MRTKHIVCAFILLGGMAVNADGMSAANAIEWRFPRLGNCHEGMPFSDGVSGILVWGGESELRLTVGRADLWDHRGGYPWTEAQNYTNIVALWRTGEKEKLLGLFSKTTPKGEPRNPYMLPLGRIIVRMTNGVTIVRGELDPFTGLGKIFLSDGKVIGLAMSKKFCVFAMDMSAVAGFSVETMHCLDYPMARRALEPLGFKPAKKRRGSGSGGFTWELPCDESVSLDWTSAAGTLTVTTHRGKSGAETPRANFEEVKSATVAQWAAFWKDGARVRVPDPVLQRIFDYGMYRFGAMTDPDGIPAGLQGPWLEDDRLVPWNGDYHFNINVQECYSPAFRGGHLENLMPLFRMILSWKPRLRENAKLFCGIENGYVMPHSVDDRGVCIGGFWTGTIDHASAAWMASYMFRYVKYSRDIGFLRESVYDFMKGVMNVYLAMMEERDGLLSIPLGPSPEWMGDDFRRAVGRNPSFQLAACHRLAQDLMAAAELLGETADRRWKDVERRLPAFSRVTDFSGDSAVWGNEIKDGIAIFEGVNLHESHRHHSHMAGIYPFDTICRRKGENREMLDATYANWVLRGTGLWTGWCVPWASILHVDAGHATVAVEMLHAWDSYFCDEGHGSHHNAVWDGFTNFRHGRDVMQMDGQCAAVTAILEMLVHEIDGEPHYFRGCPESWRSVSFENVALSNGRRINGQCVNGIVHVQEVK